MFYRDKIVMENPELMKISKNKTLYIKVGSTTDSDKYFCSWCLGYKTVSLNYRYLHSFWVEKFWGDKKKVKVIYQTM